MIFVIFYITFILIKTKFSQNFFCYIATTAPISQGTAPALLAGMPIGPGITPQPGFYSRGIWLPVVVTFQSGQAKPT